MYEPERPADETLAAPPKIRPIWLLGGGAAAIAFGVCALLSLCAAVPIVWLTVQRNNQQAETTQVAIGRQTEQAATNTPNPTRTPIGGIGTQAVPTMIPLPTQGGIATQPGFATAVMPGGNPIPGNVLPPDQAVRTYYQMVSQQRYDLSWNMLTDTFKQKYNCCAPNYNYSGYTSWWDSVDYVDFGSVNTVSQSGDRAVVYAETFYVMTTGERSSMDSTPYIELIYDTTLGGWRFNDKRAAP
jgi:hypothetical protein